MKHWWNPVRCEMCGGVWTTVPSSKLTCPFCRKGIIITEEALIEWEKKVMVAKLQGKTSIKAIIASVAADIA